MHTCRRSTGRLWTLALLAAGAAVALCGCRTGFVRQAKVAEHPSVVALYAESGTQRRLVGSAFFAAPGTLVTAHHVVRAGGLDAAGSTTLPVLVAQSADGARRKVVAVRGDARERDLVALVVEDGDGLPTLRLGESAPEAGARVAVVGYVRGSLQVATGRVVTNEWTGDPSLPGYFSATCPVAGGHSGGPLFDERGDVVGVATRGGDGTVMAQEAANAIPLLTAPARSWEVWCLAERESPSEEAAKQIDQADISYASGDPSVLERALARYRKARGLSEDEATMGLSVEGECACLTKMGRPREAVAVLAASLKERPDRAWAERLLGYYLLACGESAGYAHLQRASALDPNDVNADVELADWSYHVQPAPDPVPGLRRVVRLRPGWAKAWSLLGGLASRRGDHEEAARAWRAVTELRPDDAPAFTAHAESLYALGRNDDAREAAEAAMRLAPKEPSSRRALVLSLLGLGEREEARRALEEFRVLAPDDARTLDPLLVEPAPAGR